MAKYLVEFTQSMFVEAKDGNEAIELAAEMIGNTENCASYVEEVTQ